MGGGINSKDSMETESLGFCSSPSHQQLTWDTEEEGRAEAGFQVSVLNNQVYVTSIIKMKTAEGKTGLRRNDKFGKNILTLGHLRDIQMKKT